MEKKPIFLLADDDLDDRMLFVDALHKTCPAALCYLAFDGIEVLDLLKKNPELPEIIFLDINMPQMDGWSCLQAIKETTIYKDIPVIIYSTSSHCKDINHAFELGALCFCVKPDNYPDMQRKLKVIAENLHGDLRRAINDYNKTATGQFFLPDNNAPPFA